MKKKNGVKNAKMFAEKNFSKSEILKDFKKSNNRNEKFNMNILITGGAGYIGSNTAYKFLDDGHQVTIIDNLSTGNKKLIPKKSKFYKLDISSNKVDKILKQNAFDVVVHFAAFISVEEFKKTKKYNHNNYKTLCFLKFCIKNNVKNIIFSSTAAVYGNKFTKPVSENQKLKPKSDMLNQKKLKIFNKTK